MIRNNMQASSGYYTHGRKRIAAAILDVGKIQRSWDNGSVVLRISAEEFIRLLPPDEPAGDGEERLVCKSSLDFTHHFEPVDWRIPGDIVASGSNLERYVLSRVHSLRNSRRLGAHQLKNVELMTLLIVDRSKPYPEQSEWSED